MDSPYVSSSVLGDCLTCDHDVSRVTSLAGDAFCTIPYFDRTCSKTVTINSVTYPYGNGGYEWDESAGACVKCRPGTHRSVEDLDTVLECQEW